MENKFTNIKDRVIQVSERQNISKEAFFKSIGMTSASFRGKAKETPLNSNAIVNIITKYPDTDLYWLLNGITKASINDVHILEESSEKYNEVCKSCNEKDKMIAILKQQIVDLKLDKEDLKNLLGLKK
jgi:ribonuclease HIII